MSSFRFLASLLLVAVAFLSMESNAFAPSSQISNTACRSAVGTSKPLNLFDEQERKSLTRDSEPEEFFQTCVRQ